MRIIGRDITLLFLFAFLAVISCVSSHPSATGPHSLPHSRKPVVDAAGIEKKIHALINQERQKRDLASLERDDALSRIARGHSRDMAKREYFGHISPEGHDFSDRYLKAHYACALQVGTTIYLGAENIALNNLYASTTTVNGVIYYDWNSEEKIAQTTVQGWMNSAGHRKNILTPHLRREGIGVHIAPDDRIYITQNFC